MLFIILFVSLFYKPDVMYIQPYVEIDVSLPYHTPAQDTPLAHIHTKCQAIAELEYWKRNSKSQTKCVHTPSVDVAIRLIPISSGPVSYLFTIISHVVSVGHIGHSRADGLGC